MPASALETDYLVIGTGATAMAFVDTLLSEQADARVLMVDRHHRPGGHWNDAYSFVRLHQPSEFYGVASRELGHGVKDSTGFNAGLYGLASGAQVLAYFDQVMQQRFLPSGRVQWLPMSEHRQDAERCAPGPLASPAAKPGRSACARRWSMPPMRRPRCPPPNRRSTRWPRASTACR